MDVFIRDLFIFINKLIHNFREKKRLKKEKQKEKEKEKEKGNSYAIHEQKVDRSFECFIAQYLIYRNNSLSNRKTNLLALK